MNTEMPGKLTVPQGMRRATVVERLVYAAALFSILPRAAVSGSGWIGLALGAPVPNASRRALSALIAAAVLFRIYQVARYPHALDGYVSKGAVALRIVALIAMAVGALAGIGLLLLRPLAVLLAGSAEDGVAVLGFFFGIIFVFVGSTGWIGCLLYEISRRIGSAASTGTRWSFRWNQDVIVGVALIAICVGLPYVSRLDSAEKTCGQDRIECVAQVNAGIKRMVALPLGSGVQLVSNLDSVRFQMRLGSRLVGEATESPDASLRWSGYSPTEAESSGVRVEVVASEAGAGIVLNIEVTERGEQTATFTAKFPPDARLERDAHGAIRVLVDLPKGSDGMIKGSYRDARDNLHTLDAIYVFLRQAIGTDIEAREQPARLVRSATVVSRTDEPKDRRTVEEIRVSSAVDYRCRDKITLVRDQPARSFAASDRGGSLIGVFFARTTGPELVTYARRDARVICDDGSVWVVSGAPIDEHLSLRRYSFDGVLERFVEVPLTNRNAGRRFSFVDFLSVRETDGAIFFDRFDAERGERPADKSKLVAQESYRVAL